VGALTQGAGRLLCALHQRSEVGMSGHELPNALHHLRRKIAHQLRTEAAQGIFLIGREERELVARVGIGGHARYFRKIVGARRGMHLARLVDAELRHLQRLVVAQSQLSAAVQRERAFISGRRSRGNLRAQRQSDEENI